MATRMQQRRGTAAEWTAANPILANGELGYDTTNKFFKIGDGVTTWTSLTTTYKTSSSADIQYVDVAGDTMTGPLVIKNGAATGARLDSNTAGSLRTTTEDGSAYANHYVAELRSSAGVFDGANRVFSLSNPPPSPSTANTLVDAKGDVLVGTADNVLARVPVGNDNQVLIADSTQAAGVRWSTPATAVSFGFAEAFLHGGY